MSLFSELKRRNVFRVAIAYMTAAWLVTEVSGTVLPAFGYGDSELRVIIIILAIALVPVLVLSWLFEFTPEGLKREVEVDREQSITRYTGKKIDRLIVALLALALSYLAFDKFVIEPRRVAEIIEETAQQARSEARVASYGEKSIAVLPFVNMSDDDGNVYFSEGISEEILNLLVKIPELRVISRSSSFSFKGQAIEIPEIAERLNVAHVLEGSVRKAGNRLRITAQLIEAQTDTHIWSETYDRELTDVFSIQDEIAGEITRQLEVTLVGTGQPHIPTTNEKAYDKYLRGMYFLNQVSVRESYQKARDFFQAAIDLDPGFAEAYAQLSMTLAALGDFRVLPPTEVLPKALEAAKTALELDGNLYTGHIARGWIAMTYEHDWETAENLFRRAIEMIPGEWRGYHVLSFPLRITGRHEEALASVLKARELDPLSLWTRVAQSMVYYGMHDFEDAIEQQLSLLETMPDDASRNSWIGEMYALNQQPSNALRYAEKAKSLAKGEPNQELSVALIYATLGDQHRAREILQRVVAAGETHYVSPGYLASVYARLGDIDLAMDYLNRGVEEYDSWIFNLDLPMWDSIRGEPRFIDLCHGLKMACATPN